MLVLKHHCLLTRLLSNRSFFSKQLNGLQQRAIVAFGAIEIIKRFNASRYINDQRSIRELLLDRTFFNKLLISLMSDEGKELFRQAGRSQIDLNISQEAYLQVLSAFEISKGCQYNPKIWRQDRFRDASRYGNIVLFPVSITAQYFRMIHNGQSRLLSGSKGTGKTFSFLTYAYLSDFLVKYQVSLQSEEQNSIKKLFSQYHWGKVRQICYLNIKPSLDYSQYFTQMTQQFEHLYPLEKIKIDFKLNDKSFPFMSKILTFVKKYSKTTALKLQSFLDKYTWRDKSQRQFSKTQVINLLITVQKLANKHNIKTTCVIDQGNKIYGQLRELHKKMESGQICLSWKKSKQYQALTFYHDFLSIMTSKKNLTHFQSIIINSSQDFELQFADAYLQKFLPSIQKQIPLLSLLMKQRQFGSPKAYSQYSTLMNEAKGQIQLFNIFWFQLLMYLRVNDILGNDVKIDHQFEKNRRQHRKCFDQQFGLTSIIRGNQNILFINIWRNQVRHLDIRQYFKKREFDQLKAAPIISNQSYFGFTSLSEEQKISIRADFRFIKAQIQQRRHEQMIKNIKTYIKKSVSLEEKSLRTKHLKKIVDEAAQFSINSKGIHYSEFVKYEYLKLVSGLEKKGLVQLIKFGFVDQAALRFSMNPIDLRTVIMDAMVDNEYMYLMAMLARDLLIDPKTRNINQNIGKILDKISFPIFKHGVLQLHYKEYLVKKNQIGFTYEELPIPVSFRVNKSFHFLGVTNLKNPQLEKKRIIRQFPTDIATKGLFDKIIFQADKDENHEQFIAGYPVEYYNVQKRSFGPFDSNAAFDNMVLKRVSQNGSERNQYHIQLYDWTMGKPSSKTAKNFKQNIRGLLKLVELKADIKVKLLIVTPQYYVQDYLKSLQYSRNQKRVENLFWSEDFQEEIDGKNVKRSISISLASFQENLPFEHVGSNFHLIAMHQIISQTYKYIKNVSVEIQH